MRLSQWFSLLLGRTLTLTLPTSPIFAMYLRTSSRQDRKTRRRNNNILILLVAGIGLLLLSMQRLIEPHNSLLLLPPESQLQALVFAEHLLMLEQGQWHSEPALEEEAVARLLTYWRQAQLIAIAEPEPLPRAPILVDIYFSHTDMPTTALLYPHLAAIKLQGQPQWWRLVNQEMGLLLPKSVGAN